MNVNNSDFKTSFLCVSERKKEKKRRFSCFDSRQEERNQKIRISRSDRFSEFHFVTSFPLQLDKKTTNFRLSEFNVNVLRNIKHDNKNLRKTINFTTLLSVDSKTTADIAKMRLLA